MFSPNERAKIIALINREVVPAIGCTEPIAVALCTARAAELLDTQPEKIEVRLSANILKNAMGVGHSRHGNDRPADRRGAGCAGRPFGIPIGGPARRDAEARRAGRRYIDEKRVASR